MVGSQTVDRSPRVDLTNCDREPIHIPSAIQPHGFLLVVDTDHQIIQQSSNVEEHLAVSEPLIGSSLSEWLSIDAMEEIERYWAQTSGAGQPMQLPGVELTAGSGRWDLVVHRHGGLLIVEILPAVEEPPLSAHRRYQLVRNSTARLRSARSLDELCRSVVREVRGLTGFDRVMVYRFDRDWNGVVVAEDKLEELESWLGLHYPASDIPTQARKLYSRNLLRLIADVDYRPAALEPVKNPVTAEPLDMSHCVLRSVSPIHVQYLKNMGVAASMSVSIMNGDRLWGLIACHHGEPHFLSHELLTSCELFGQMMSAQLPWAEQNEISSQQSRTWDTRSRLIAAMEGEPDYLANLVEGDPNLLDLLDAGGAGVWRDDTYKLLGEGPDAIAAKQIVTWLEESVDDPVRGIDSLSQLLPEAQQWTDTASGLLAARISRSPRFYLLWYRPEVVRTVNWAGNPEKPVLVEDPSSQIPELTPRRSFELWKQTVHGAARPWADWEIQVVQDLRNAVLSQEVARANRELVRSNEELDSFAYIISHDLKEPLRGMQSFTEFLIEDFSDQLALEGRERLRTLSRLGQRMEHLIDALLHYSRLGRVDLAQRETDLDNLVRSTIEAQTLLPRWRELEISIPRPMPTLMCDRVRIGELYYNLLSNAAKYNDKDQRIAEVGYLTPDEAAANGVTPPSDGEHPGDHIDSLTDLVLYVRDNGIGIPKRHWKVVFNFFKRLHGRDKFGGGTGAGLAIVQTIVHRHGGHVWLESTESEGTTFYFTLPQEPKS